MEEWQVLQQLREKLIGELTQSGHTHIAFAIKHELSDHLSSSDKMILENFARKVRGISDTKVTFDSGFAGPSPSAGSPGWSRGE